MTAANGAPSWRGRAGSRTLALPIFLVLLMLGSALSVLSVSSAGPVAIGTPMAATPDAAATSHLGLPAPGDVRGSASERTAAPAAPLAPSSSGRGVFFNTSNIAFPPAGDCATLFGYACDNDSYDPSINFSAAPPTGPLSSTPVLGVAFTQVTDASPCAAVSTEAETEIGFAYSLDLGTTWSTPTYLGLTNCTLAATLPSAYQPTLTSLANGTFALAYIAYNVSSEYQPWYEQDLGGVGGSFSITGAALVLTESYDGGLIWTPPEVLNESLNPAVLINCCNANTTHAYTPQRPWITAIGETLYLAWTNDTYSAGFDYYCEVALYEYSACYGEASSQVHLLVSKDGGTTWQPRSNLITVRPPLNTTISAGEDPYVLVTPNGTVFVAYVTDVYLPDWATRQATGNYLASGAIEVARSTDNGSTFQYVTAATNLTLDDGPDNPPFQGGQWGSVVAPQLAWSSRYSDLYLTWTMSVFGPNVQCPTTCPANELYENIYLARSSNNGATWGPYHLVSSGLNDSAGSAAYNPAIAVVPDGEVDIATAFVDLNSSVNYCAYVDEGYCPLREEFVSSTDNGTTFSAPILITDNITATPTDDPSGWYDTATVVDGAFYVAWAQKWAVTQPGNISLWPGTCCGYAQDHSQIAVSHRFTGTGVSLYYNETGLPIGFPWGVDVMGNLYDAVAPGSITVTGVPPLENLNWTVTIVPGSSYGFRYQTNETPRSPAGFAGSTTIYENFTEEVLLQIFTDPTGTECPTLGNQAQFVVCWNPPMSYYSHFTYNVYPFVGARWVPDGVPVALNASLANLCFSSGACYIYTSWMNLSFQSWTGSGAGSTNTAANQTTITPIGPVNETANFQVVGICTNANTGSFDPDCSLNETLEFHETGLPAGTEWNVSIQNDAGQTQLVSGTTPTLTFISAATTGIVNYTVWTVPSSVTGEVWNGSATPGSPVELPVDRVVNVTFALAPASSTDFALTFSETGLPDPSATGWEVQFGAQDVGLHAARGGATVTGGTAALDVPSVYYSNGTGYYAQTVSVSRQMVNGSAPVNFTSLPASLSLDGPSIVTVTFVPEYYVTISSSPGGTTSPASEWVPIDDSVNLTATPSVDYHFTGWAGSGPGAISASTSNLQVRVAGPVVEAATFEWNGPDVWTLNVVESGLSAGTTYTVEVGNQSYTGTGSFNITGLSTGDYTIAIPYEYSNISAGTRYLGNLSGTTLPFAGAATISIAENGTIDLSFVPQYEIAFSASAGGSITPSPGSDWVDAGLQVPATATPSGGFQFAGWFGQGPGAVSGASPSISPIADGPFTEFADFQSIPAPPSATFSLTVTQTGLPDGVSWAIEVGVQTVTGAGATLVVPALNGTYSISVPDATTSPGVRYIATNAPTTSVQVASNQSLALTFQEQYWVGISAAIGGTVAGTSEWINAGSTVTVVPTPSPGWAFLGWVTQGTGTFSGSTTLSFTPSGPFNVTATFQPVTGPSSSGSGTGIWIGVGAFVVLAIAAAAVAVLLLRRREPPASPAEPPDPAATDATPDELSEPPT
jgi:hypothetical protein